MRMMVSAAAALFFASCFSAYSDDAPKRDDLRVRRGEFVSAALLTGELEAARGEMISVPALPQWQTSIKWLATEGSEVRKGDRVVELDNSAFTTDLDSKRQTELQVLQEIQQKASEWKADLEQKQLDFETRRSEYDKARIDASVPAEILSAREYEDRQMKFQRARVEYDKARDVLASQKKSVQADRSNLELQLEKAQREVRRSEQAIESLVITAPRDGIVVVRDNPWEGRKLQAGDTVWVGFPIALIPELSSLQVAAWLADVDDGRVSPGMPADITMDGYPTVHFTGKVSSISAVAQESARQSLRRAFKVIVALDAIDAQRMRPGFSARVIVQRERKPNVLIAPRAALDLSSPKPRARRADGGWTGVTLGACNAQDCVVVDGLKENDRLAAIDGVGHA